MLKLVNVETCYGSILALKGISLSVAQGGTSRYPFMTEISLTHKTIFPILPHNKSKFL